MTTTEKLNAIKSKCEELLALAEKRTPGKWEYETEVFDGYGGDERGHYVRHNHGLNVCLDADKDDCQFIAACAGSAEAGWRATIAAINGLIAAESLIYSVQNDYDESPVKWWVEQRGKVMEAQSAILAAWEGLV